jgi:4-hydroxy-tetrahydrodipicolinate reductase
MSHVSEPSAGLRLGVAGARGRMGRAVLALAAQRPDLEVAAAFGSPGSEGAVVEGFALTTAAAALEACEVIVDFSTAAASRALAESAAERGAPALVIGSTGFNKVSEAAITYAARRIAIVKSGNFSLAVNLLASLVEQAAERLAAADWDIEILEAHHRGKTDAPSGTAQLLGEAAAHGRGARLAELAAPSRRGARAARAPGAIGFASLRGGGIVGEHAVVFAAEDEILTLAHSARDRRLFARGALAAAAWAAKAPPGLYDMKNVLGL